MEIDFPLQGGRTSRTSSPGIYVYIYIHSSTSVDARGRVGTCPIQPALREGGHLVRAKQTTKTAQEVIAREGCPGRGTAQPKADTQESRPPLLSDWAQHLQAPAPWSALQGPRAGDAQSGAPCKACFCFDGTTRSLAHLPRNILLLCPRLPTTPPTACTRCRLEPRRIECALAVP